MRLSLKLASDPDGRSLESPEDRVAPLTALEQKGPDQDYTAEQLQSRRVDPRTWAPSTRSRIPGLETLVGWPCRLDHPTPQPAMLCGAPGRLEDQRTVRRVLVQTHESSIQQQEGRWTVCEAASGF